MNSRGALRRSRIVVLGSVVATAMLLAGCSAPDTGGSGDETTTEAVTIGFVGGLSGAGAAYGTAALNAAQLVADEVNEAGGVERPDGSHVTIDLLALDDRTETSGVAEGMRRLTEQENVPVIVGGLTTGNAVVAGDLAQRAQVPLLHFALGDSTTSQGFDHVFRITAGTGQLADRAVEFVVETSEALDEEPTIGLLVDDGVFSQDAAASIRESLAAADLEIAEEVTYSIGGVSDFTPLLGRFISADVDVLFEAVTPADGVAIVTAMKSLDWAPEAAVHVGGAAANAEFWKTLGADADYTIGSTGYVQELAEGVVPELAEFSARFEEEYGVSLDESSSSGAVMMGLVIDALETIETIDAESFTEHLRGVDLDDGHNQYIIRYGGVKFAPNGDNERVDPPVFQIIEGTQRVVYPAAIASTEVTWPAPEWQAR